MRHKHCSNFKAQGGPAVGAACHFESKEREEENKNRLQVNPSRVTIWCRMCSSRVAHLLCSAAVWSGLPRRATMEERGPLPLATRRALTGSRRAESDDCNQPLGGQKKAGFCHCAFLQNLLKATVQISRILQVFAFFFFLVCMVLARHPKWFSGGGDLSPAEDEASDRVFVDALAAQMEARFTYTSVIVA